MKVLVVGSGGREHALCWMLSRSRKVTEVLCAPGNGGTGRVARNVAVPVDDLDGLYVLARREQVGLVVVGPEAPLCRGLADRLREAGILVFGPSKAAAELEGSKAFAKDLMNAHGIPTAGYRTFRRADDALEYLTGAIAWPVVVKASGLASGKGVIICSDLESAKSALNTIMNERVFGPSGDVVVIEDFLSGEEISLHCLTDGETLLILPTSQDHKRALDGDQGPNTGGMGAISPAPHLDAAGLQRVEKEILFPTLHALARTKRPYRGALFAGLMATRTGPKVLEYNVRFGDPETQVLMRRMQGDLMDFLVPCAEGRLSSFNEKLLEFDPRVAVGVVLCSGGYPGVFHKGDAISGIESAERDPDVIVFHAGTALIGGRLVTDGGRVMTVTALGKDAEEARRKAYAAVAKIYFSGMHFRKDIGNRAVKAAKAP